MVKTNQWGIDISQQGGVKVIDFGTAHPYGSQGKMQQIIGNPYYMSTESV